MDVVGEQSNFYGATQLVRTDADTAIMTQILQFSLELRCIIVLFYILKFCYEFFVAVGS